MKQISIGTIELPRIGLVEIELGCAVHLKCEGTTAQIRPSLRLESGWAMLLENGSRMALESKRGMEYAPQPERTGSIAKEDKGLLMLENGGTLKLEQSNKQPYG